MDEFSYWIPTLIKERLMKNKLSPEFRREMNGDQVSNPDKSSILVNPSNESAYLFE